MKVHTQKKLGLLVILLTIFQTVSCNQAPAESLSMFETALPSEFDNRDLYNFEEIEAVVDPGLGQSMPVDTVQPVVLEDKTVSDYFTTNKIKTLITQETKNGKTIRTTKTWTTRNPSYLTWANAGLAAAAVGAAGLYASGLNVEDLQKAAGNISSKFAFGKQNDAPATVTPAANVTTDAKPESSALQKALPYAAAAGGAYLGYKVGPAVGATIGGLGGSAIGGIGGAITGATGKVLVNGAKVGVAEAALGGAAAAGALSAVTGGATGLIAGPIAGGYYGYKGGEILADNQAKPSAPSVKTAQAAPAVDGNDSATITMPDYN
jgi:hypothetical protein